MFVVALVYVSRYAMVNPFVDEWDFVPVLFGEKPAGPWLWELHNEHRFPLPRVIYLSLFRIIGDLRPGCFVTLLGISVLAAGLMRLGRKVRGRSSLCDAIFPLLLMQVGQDENLYMGYQMCFMLTSALAGGLLAVMVRWRQVNSFRVALLATLLGWLVLMCGAGGLAYGVAAAGWVALLAFFGRMPLNRRLILLALSDRHAGLHLVVLSVIRSTGTSSAERRRLRVPSGCSPGASDGVRPVRQRHVARDWCGHLPSRVARVSATWSGSVS